MFPRMVHFLRESMKYQKISITQNNPCKILIGKKISSNLSGYLERITIRLNMLLASLKKNNVGSFTGRLIFPQAPNMPIL